LKTGRPAPRAPRYTLAHACIAGGPHNRIEQCGSDVIDEVECRKLLREPLTLGAQHG